MLTQIRRPDHRFQAFFRYRSVGEKVVLTGLEGNWLILTRDEFARFAEGSVEPGSALEQRLHDGNFLADKWNSFRAGEGLRTRKGFLKAGPNLHIVVVTLRCNETCVYCHASRADMDAVATDMSPETADRTVDLILQTTSDSVTIEFQGGEPLVAFPIVRRIVERAVDKNRALGKQLEFTMVSNLSLLDEEKLAWLLDHRVQICTSIDGPAPLHDKQRKLPGLSAFDQSARWIRRINEAYVERGLDPSLYHVEALLTTTAETLPRWKEVVDTYVGLGCRALFLRPLDPFGFADRTAPRIEYPRADYLAFYRAAVDYMLELNRQGVQVLERFAAIFLTKILGGFDPNYLDIRSPCGAGIGQVAYNHDGRVYTCDEGRMLHAMGDATFEIGDVSTSGYRDLMGHPTVRALAIASNLDAQPDCTSCAYNPYCGTCPVHNHRTQGTIFGRMRESTLCAVHKGIQDYLFGKLGEADPAVLETFERWTTVRERTHFLQTCST
jgi:His-Xaa-Ser system radical SAM maturase HxsB